jgi:hypothetical protein
MKAGASQQGRTPSQLAAATPPVSTPFSNAAHTALSPMGPRSSPQHVKKSPATLIGHIPGGALNFDSPSTYAAFGGQPMADHELEQQNQRERAFASEADKVQRLEDILAILNVCLSLLLRKNAAMHGSDIAVVEEKRSRQ